MRELEQIRTGIRSERVVDITWKPRRHVSIPLGEGNYIDARWRCEHLVRAYTAQLGVYKGVRVDNGLERVRILVRQKTVQRHCGLIGNRNMIMEA